MEPEVVAETMNTWIREGKILGWGLSNAPVEYMKRAHAVCPLTAVENQYSICGANLNRDCSTCARP